jgi:uncharacterized protein (TIGR02145 family)
LKTTSGWNGGGNGTDQYGFSALPGGNGYSDGSFFSVGDGGSWWSASETEYNSNYAYYRSIGFLGDGAFWGVNPYKDHLFSVRCVQD